MNYPNEGFFMIFVTSDDFDNMELFHWPLNNYNTTVYSAGATINA